MLYRLANNLFYITNTYFFCQHDLVNAFNPAQLSDFIMQINFHKQIVVNGGK